MNQQIRNEAITLNIPLMDFILKRIDELAQVDGFRLEKMLQILKIFRPKDRNG